MNIYFAGEVTRGEKGQFIVLYGVNNLGKTTQARLLVDTIGDEGLNVRYLKYPIYDLKPTGPEINKALRENLSISDLELQKLFVQNRRDYQPQLENILDSGVHVIAEDYKGTGIAWGVVNGIPLEKMELLNYGLQEEDLAILIDGERRFMESIEHGHRYEENRDWFKARDVHRLLADRYDWQIVNGNQSISEVNEQIWQLVKQRLEAENR